MDVFQKNFIQDLKSPVNVRHCGGIMFTGDALADTITVTLYNGEQPAALTGTVVCKVIRSDGATVAFNGERTGNVVSATLNASCFAVAGPISVILQVVDGDTKMSVLKAVYTVDAGTTETIVDPGEIIPDVTNLIEQIQAAVGSIPPEYSAMLATIAPNFSASTAYAAGQYVWNSGTLYRFTADHPAGAWIGTDATAAVIGKDVAEIKRALINEIDIIGEAKTVFYYDHTVAHSSSNDMVEINVKTGEKITLEAIASQNVTCQIFAYASDGSPATRIAITPANTAVEYTAETDIKAFGLYVAAYDQFESQEITFVVKKENALTKLLPDHAFFEKEIVFRDGYKVRADNGAISEDATYSYVELSAGMLAGSLISGYTNVSPWASNGLAFYDMDDKFISGAYNTTAGSYDWNFSVAVPDNAFTLRISCRTDYKSTFKIAYNWSTANQNIEDAIKMAHNNHANLETVNRILDDAFIPELRNGSAGNPTNTNSISTDYIYPIDFTKDNIFVEYTGDASLADHYAWGYCKFSGATDGMKSTAAFNNTSITKSQYNSGANQLVSVPWISVPTRELTGYDHIMFFLFRYKDGVQVPLRIATDQYSFRVTWRHNEGVAYRDADFSKTKHDLLYAKHAPGNTGSRLTLLHFSDIHADTGALARIMNDAGFFEYDDAICTGDLVDNAAGQIASWWDPSVMTCIGNHDSASYDRTTSTYDWTALSMADRDAYYIAPFESNWGITHTSGTSYYYKDYADQHVRLIVMDAMLYTGTPGAEATAQTTWLENLLADAITNNLHVLIAVHSPHGGAEPIECSFTRYGETTMPTYGNCNVPQSVIDVVAAKITTGLKFIGYIVGHTHQDDIWDAENDGTQLMYCVAGAIVSNPNSWKGSDQHRDTQNDAYNLVTIDTANTLIKIIRGGGANIDDHMRTRKAICFDYSTGQLVGEVL